MKFGFKMVYGVFQSIEVLDSDTGRTIAEESESEYYDSFEEANKRADELRQLIDEQICSWGNDIGILRYVYVDEEPRGEQVLLD